MDELLSLKESEVLKSLISANFELASVALSETKKTVKDRIAASLDHAEISYNTLSETVKNLAYSEKLKYQNRLSVYKQRTEEMKERLKNLDKAESTIGENPQFVDMRFEKTLSEGIRSQEIGVKTLEKLQMQKGTITKFSQAECFKENINEADQALFEFSMKRVKLKMSMLLICFLEIVILLLILYIKIR
ncbi:hypothetical protein SteCoe_18719 [Stentor coeruleus]|uniref:Vesicle transport v-SNARE N-terminal domain-containing protein n=1 Tax=Stentor coeruleus TaxID=5963 RepID=A0A1R2BVW4_9CILI|nr:hypothetical protein SteCoe_18719 [Stentor coeruleus]